METKAICIEPNFPGTKLFEVGDEADLSEIDYNLRYCFEIGGVRLDKIEEISDKRFYLSRETLKDAKEVGKKLKAEIKEIEGKSKSLEAENAELKLKLAKLEGGGKKKDLNSAAVEVETIVNDVDPMIEDAF